MILNQINDRIGNLEGKIGIYYLDLTVDSSCFAGNCQVFASSGLAKIAVLLEVFRQMEAGKLKATERYVLDREKIVSLSSNDQESSYGALRFLHSGLELTIQDLYSLMITVSDNIAFNILLERVGIEQVNATMRAWGFRHIEINRKFFDYEKMAAGVENYHSVQEMAEIFRRLYMGQLISGKASGEILTLLRCHQRTNVLPYYFSENQSMAHQTGFDDGQLHDVGVVFSDAPFILSMSAANTDTRKAESVMRDIALICYKNSKELCRK